MRGADLDAATREYFVAATLDTGFRRMDVFHTLMKVIKTRQGVRGMSRLFRSSLSLEGYKYAMEFCDSVIESN